MSGSQGNTFMGDIPIYLTATENAIIAATAPPNSYHVESISRLIHTENS
jgi:hypothetical protein